MRGSRRGQAYLLAGDDRCPFCSCLRHGADLSESSGSDSPGRASGQPLPLHVVLKTALLDAASHGSGEGQGKDPSLQTIGLVLLGGRIRTDPRNPRVLQRFQQEAVGALWMNRKPCGSDFPVAAKVPRDSRRSCDLLDPS